MAVEPNYEYEEFIFVNKISVEEQILRLLCYMRNEQYTEETNQETLSSAQKKIRFMRMIEELDHSDIWNRDLNEEEMISFLTCFLSILDSLTVARDDVPVLHETFAKLLSETNHACHVAATKTILMNQFLMLVAKEHSSSLAVFRHLIHYCTKFSVSPHPTITIDQAMKWVDKWNADDKDTTVILSVMDRMYELAGRSTESLECQLKLLKRPRVWSINDQSVVVRAIFHSIREPSVYLFDNLLSIDAVKKLEGEPSFELLSLFAFGTLSQYKSFWARMQSNPRFLSMFYDYGLTNEACTEKIKMLTFVQLCEDSNEIKFEDIVRSLELDSEDCIEPFVVNAVKSKLVECLIDVANRKVLVNSSIQRLFKINNWAHVMDRIKSWHGNVANTVTQAV